MISIKKYILIALVALLPTMSLWAQTSTFSVGVRGGGLMWLPEAVSLGKNAASSLGGEGLVEFRYTYYGHVGLTTGLGITAGIDAGYSTSGFYGTHNLLYIPTTSTSGWERFYYNDAVDYKQTEQYMRTDISLMMALHAGGFVLNVGPRFMMPFFGTENTSGKSNNRAAYVEPNINETSSAALPLCNLLMGIEAGWEFPLSSGALGLQAYADVGVWHNQKKYIPSASPASVYSPPDVLVVTTYDGSGIPRSTIQSANGIVKERRLVDFGIRLYYSFYSSSYVRRKRPCPPWDTRLHHNRTGSR